MTMRKKHQGICRLAIGWAFALVAGGSGVSGQDVRIETLSFPKGPAGKIELLTEPGKTIEVTLQSHALADPLVVPRLPVWKFGRSEVDAAGEPRFRTLAEVKPGPARRQLLIFVRKGPAVEDGFEVIPLNAGAAGFGEGKMFIMNLARREVAGQVGGRQFVLPPGQHVEVKPKADRPGGLSYALLRYKKGEKWRTLFSTNWPILKDARGLVFAYDGPGSKSVRLHSVVDALIEVEEDAAP